MKDSNITDLVSRMTPPRGESSEHRSLALVKLSITIFELADVVNLVIDSLFRTAGTSLGEVLQDYEKNPTQRTCALIEELHPHVEKLVSLAEERIKEIELEQGA